MKRAESTITVSEMAQEILAYLVENPDAQDTLEGIIEWWFLDERIKRQTAKGKDALAELVAKGLVVERQGMNSRTHYRINRRRLRKIRALLEQGSR
ncbi:MAG TPA: hypothetical protein VNM72_02585 [Blastocatellia bacterium]|nr:hypothetical protein [Blastocatellia bacterium]